MTLWILFIKFGSFFFSIESLEFSFQRLHWWIHKSWGWHHSLRISISIVLWLILHILLWWIVILVVALIIGINFRVSHASVTLLLVLLTLIICLLTGRSIPLKLFKSSIRVDLISIVRHSWWRYVIVYLVQTTIITIALADHGFMCFLTDQIIVCVHICWTLTQLCRTKHIRNELCGLPKFNILGQNQFIVHFLDCFLWFLIWSEFNKPIVLRSLGNRVEYHFGRYYTVVSLFESAE